MSIYTIAVAVAISYAACEIVKHIALHFEIKQMEQLAQLSREALNERDLKKADRLQHSFEHYKENVDRRTQTPWFFPSAWRNE